MSGETIRAVRGVRDYLPELQKYYNYIVNKAKFLAEVFCYEEIALPIFEFSSIYERGLGEESDLLLKELYRFTDKSNNLCSLRPEFTAGIVRAILSNNLYNQLPLKWFSFGPLFRYERPQKGRFRQFHQLNFEFIGEVSYHSDVDIILLVKKLLEQYKILDKVTLNINSLGDAETRVSYRNKLKSYLEAYKNDLSDISKLRLERNPLRILDSKEADDKKILEGAPVITDSYNSNTRKNFDNILNLLEKSNINYKLNEKLVRGLDYYSHMVFEFNLNDTRSQNAIAAGGRYDSLFEQLGNKQISAVGAALGIERIIDLISDRIDLNIISKPACAFISKDEQYNDITMSYMQKFLDNNLKASLIINRSIDKSIKKAYNKKMSHIIVIGNKELETNLFSLKKLEDGSIISDNFEEIIRIFATL